MSCKCGSANIASVSGKVADMSSVRTPLKSFKGYSGDYVPLKELQIGEGDYIRFDYCLDCGNIQGEFPVDMEKLVQD